MNSRKISNGQGMKDMNQVKSEEICSSFCGSSINPGLGSLAVQVQYAFAVAGRFSGSDGTFRSYMKNFDDVKATLGIDDSSPLKILRVCLAPQFKEFLDDILDSGVKDYSKVIEKLARTIDSDKVYIDRTAIRGFVLKGLSAHSSLQIYASKFMQLIKELNKNPKSIPLSNEKSIGLYLKGIDNFELKEELKQKFRSRMAEEWDIEKFICFSLKVEEEIGTDTLSLAEKYANEYLGLGQNEICHMLFQNQEKAIEKELDIDALCDGIKNVRIAATVVARAFGRIPKLYSHIQFFFDLYYCIIRLRYHDYLFISMSWDRLSCGMVTFGPRVSVPHSLLD